VINVVWNLLAVLSVGATSVVFAENPKDDSSPNTWGKAASGLGQQQLMGDHASNPPDLDPTQPGREGKAMLHDYSAEIILAIFPVSSVHQSQQIPCVSKENSFFF
jgi:hypothetical protein